jgi:GNAT superfamily N-acetyltransferase
VQSRDYPESVAEKEKLTYARIGSLPVPCASEETGEQPMSELDVRQADFDDLRLLAAAFGERTYFDDRYERQKNGLGVLFTAWLDEWPVGHVYLWMEEAEEAPINQYLPGIPLLTHLRVLPGYRNRRIGTRLIAEVQDYLAHDDYWHVALAARTDNDEAIRLYQRLGYRDWDHGLVECVAVRTNPDGDVEYESEQCHVLLRRLVRSCYD